MGFLNGLFKKNSIVLGAHAAGKCISIREVKDSVFGQEILGKGIAIEPTKGTFYSPVDGTVTTVFGTKHAVGITSDEGIELMVHVGIDTVELKGEHFSMKVSENQRVKKGDLLLEADLDAIKAKGYQVISPLVICNSSEMEEITMTALGKDVVPGTAVVTIKK